MSESQSNTIDEADDFIPLAETLIKDKILHALRIWPMISPSMLQVGIGTAIMPKLWHPILEQLISEGKVERYEVRAHTPAGRDQTYVILRRTDMTIRVP